MKNPHASNDNVTAFREFATKTAKILGYTVVAERGSNGNPAYVEIAGPDDIRLSMFLRSESGRFRIFVNGLLPRIGDRPHSPHNTKRITLALETKPARAAGHIRGRLLPLYLEQLTEAKKRRLESESREAAKELAIQKLTAAGAQVVHREDGRLRIEIAETSMAIRIPFDGRIEIDLRELTWQQALAVFDALKS